MDHLLQWAQLRQIHLETRIMGFNERYKTVTCVDEFYDHYNNGSRVRLETYDLFC